MQFQSLVRTFRWAPQVSKLHKCCHLHRPRMYPCSSCICPLHMYGAMTWLCLWTLLSPNLKFVFRYPCQLKVDVALIRNLMMIGMPRSHLLSIVCTMVLPSCQEKDMSICVDYVSDPTCLAWNWMLAYCWWKGPWSSMSCSCWVCCAMWL